MGKARDYIPALAFGHKIYPEDMASPLTFGGKYIYVDGDHGADGGNSGISIEKPFKTIQAAIDSAGEWDVIYIAAIDPDADASEPGTYEEDLTVPYAKHGLSLIGVNGGDSLQPFMGPKVKNATATSLLNVKAPGIRIKGLQFNCTRNSGTYGILLTGHVGYTTLAGSVGAVIEDCYFKNASATYGAVSIEGGYASRMTRLTNHLGSDTLAVNFTNSAVPSNGHTIEWCNFKSNNGASVALHIAISASTEDFNIDHCNFDQATKFITMIDGCSGLISNSNFNDGSDSVLAKSTGKIEIPAALDEVGVANCWSGNGVSVLADGG